MNETTLDIAATVAETIAARLESHLVIQPTLTLADAAEQLGINQETLRLWCAAGEIPHIKIGKFYRIKPRDINAYLEKNYRAATVALGTTDAPLSHPKKKE